MYLFLFSSFEMIRNGWNAAESGRDVPNAISTRTPVFYVFIHLKTTPPRPQKEASLFIKSGMRYVGGEKVIYENPEEFRDLEICTRSRINSATRKRV
jgi:hypothetical protein